MERNRSLFENPEENFSAVESSEASSLTEPTSLPLSVEEESGSNAELKIGRNEDCPCGSGKKYKKCCQLDPV